MNQSHEFALAAAVIVWRSEGMLSNQPTRSKDDEVKQRNTRFISWCCQHCIVEDGNLTDKHYKVLIQSRYSITCVYDTRLGTEGQTMEEMMTKLTKGMADFLHKLSNERLWKAEGPLMTAMAALLDDLREERERKAEAMTAQK